MGGRRPQELEPGETVLWTGCSLPRKRPRWLWVLLLGYLIGLAALGSAWNWGVAIQSGLTTLFFTAADRWRMKATLTRGRYTVTTRRVLVEATWWGRPICRAERLSDLAKAAVTDYRGGRAVEFGDREKSGNPGHRSNGMLIAPLALFVGDEADRLLEVVRTAQQG
ncbi:hypothetical protein ACFORO_28185 [Amycolatopsis halotolerans]|uniref:PH domain-containing protein n=1 Tax=Amycolatopsis halotolerans TaxID=330083 RepID=A0ABV7QLZ4_9PSEU